MKAYEETIAALGRPVWVREVGNGPRPAALIARFKNGGARLEVNSADAMRVCLNLCGGMILRSGNGSGPAQPLVRGRVGLMAPDRPSAVQIDGKVDVFQVFVDRAVLDNAADRRFDCVPALGLNDRKLVATTVRLFMGARRDGPDDELSRQTDFWLLMEQLLARQSSGDEKFPRGGMSSRAMRRVDDLIMEQLYSTDSTAPSIDDLAVAASMSVSHFIRAFRHSTGMTPHQHVLSRRIERAMVLLARGHLSVAEIAAQTGYASPAHFVASFKQRLGITPGTYRESLFA